jgi:dihydrofolate reductase
MQVKVEKPISIIVAIAENNAIGKNNNLLWHISADLKHFKELTTGHTVVMGKKTWESLPIKPLPNRKNIVITDIAGETIDQVTTVYSIEQALDACDTDTENFIIGGGSIYQQFFPIAQKLYITKVLKPFEADTFFPEIDNSSWNKVEESELMTDEKSGLQYVFQLFLRK